MDTYIEECIKLLNQRADIIKELEEENQILREELIALQKEKENE